MWLRRKPCSRTANTVGLMYHWWLCVAVITIIGYPRGCENMCPFQWLSSTVPLLIPNGLVKLNFISIYPSLSNLKCGKVISLWAIELICLNWTDGLDIAGRLGFNDVVVRDWCKMVKLVNCGVAENSVKAHDWLRSSFKRNLLALSLEFSDFGFLPPSSKVSSWAWLPWSSESTIVAGSIQHYRHNASRS